MKSLGLTLSDELDMEDFEFEPKSQLKTFNNFDYPSNKAQQKSFSPFEYSLDDSMNIVVEEVPARDKKTDEIIQRQERLIDLLKEENSTLKLRVKQLQQLESSYKGFGVIVQEMMPICYLLNVEYNSQFVFVEIYQAIENIMNQLAGSQDMVRELQRRIKQNRGTQRVNSSTYFQKPYGKDNRNRRGDIQYRQKQEVSYVEKLEKEVQQLRQQCNKLRNSSSSTPLFVPSIKEKRVEVIVEKERVVQKVVEKVVQKPVFIQKIIEKPQYIQRVVEKPVYFQKKVKQQVPVFIDKIVQKPVPIYIDREIQVQKLVYVKQSSGNRSIGRHTQTQ